MPIVPGTQHTVTRRQGIGGVVSSTKDPNVGIENGRSMLPADYTTLTIAQSAITEANPGVFTSAAHGLATNDLLTYHSEGGTALVTGSSDTASDGDVFWVKYVSADTFQLTATASGTGLQVSTDGNDNQTFSRPIGKVV
tara:strand:- start:126 stop:542 length:417 start_codon:yes stop_codon:yes gene_type:complete